MVIGKGGARLRAIGAAARREIERLVGGPVYLELQVKVAGMAGLAHPQAPGYPRKSSRTQSAPPVENQNTCATLEPRIGGHEIPLAFQAFLLP
jgi:hypothetical protein